MRAEAKREEAFAADRHGRGDALRIAMIAPHFPEYALLLGNALAARASVELFVARPRLDSEFFDRVMPVAHALRIRDTDFQSPLTVATIVARLAAFRPDIVHIQEPSGFAKAVICAAVVAAVGPFCRLALTVHDPEPHVGRDARIVRSFAKLRTYIRRQADVVFVHGDYCRERYEPYAPAGQTVALTEHGVLLQGTETEPRTDTGFDIVFFGRMEEYKGVEILCRAAEMMSAQDIDFGLNVVGAGPELDRLEPRLRRIAQVRVDKRFLPSSTLIETIAAADCVVMPYLEATQSGVLAAAFANGKFVVASAVGGLPDVVTDGENGLLVPPGDPGALAAALTRVARDPALRRRLAAGARATAAGRLQWRRIADDLLPCYGVS